MAETSAAAGMHEFLLWWVSGGMAGTRRICAPDADAAREHLQTNGSRYGLHEKVEVLKILRCVVIEPADDRVRD